MIYFCLSFALRLISLLFLSFLVVFTSAEPIDDLTLYIDDYPPFNFVVDERATGISVEIMDAILKGSGSKLSASDVKMLPWARGYHFALKNRNTILFAMTRTPERENLFRWVGPITESNMVVLARKTDNIKIDDIKALKKYSLGAVRKDIGAELLRRHLGDEVVIELTNNGLASAKQLEKGRIDLWSYEKNVAFWFIKKAGLDPNDYEVVYTIEYSSEWFAINKETDAAIVEKLQKALDKFGDEGRNKILNKYLY